MYIDLKKLLDKIENRGVTIQIENRKLLGYYDDGFPKQHVEVLNYHNRSDDDYWDGLVFGYKNPNMNYDKKYRTKAIVGIILVEDGNHKLIFKIPYKRGFDERIFKKDVEVFVRNYRKKWGLKTKFFNKTLIRCHLKSETG